MKHEATQQQLALACRSLADEIMRGPSFFDAGGKPTAAVERYNGSRLTKDSERCALVAALKLLAYSDRQIAEVIRCDVRSIPLMVQEIEKSGAIPALKERLVRLTGANAEQSSIAIGELVGESLAGRRSLELAAMIKAVGSVADFMTTKYQLLTGAPTEIRATVSAASQDEVSAWAKANAIEVPAAVESESTAPSPIPQQSAVGATARLQDDAGHHPQNGAGGGSLLVPPGGKP